ncbi:caspase family protein [Jiella marina]|uniref:caspase family protein n=1 Tax=Jiella sp. LLJ827 TaxID=2917712 RepID=UPI0021015171|nr:caspase family protein [Jiella sp. LLJ827]MCQ0986896.1 caspase family protein [Jiella sp. LLJ827]
MIVRTAIGLVVGLAIMGLSLFTTTLAIAAPPPEKRVALVVGNSAYEHTIRLDNPSRDARAVADKLQRLGFTVIEGYDLDKIGMDAKVQEFARSVRDADLGLFFYAGHGMQVNGRNYLVPVDAMFEDPSDLDFNAVPMDFVTRQMRYDVGVRLVVLDACRDNPLSRSLARSMGGGTRSAQVSDGLAKIEIGGDGSEGTAIIFATSPDEVAYDGEGTNHSPFTQAFLDQVDAPDTDIQVVMSRVTGQVLEATKNKQRPWISASLTGEVYLNPQSQPDAENRLASLEPAVSVSTSPARVVPAAPELGLAAAATSGGSDDADSLARETALYNIARESGLRADYEAYVETFPNGLYVVNARKHIERLRGAGQAAVVASLDPSTGAQVSRQDPVAAANPATPKVDTALRTLPSGAGTESVLGLDRQKRKELQLRLNLAGFNSGTPDGIFGPNTRNAIIAWQSARGVHVSGYMNQPQYDLLVQQTQAALAAYVPPAPKVTTRKKTRSYTKKRHSKPRVIGRVKKRRSGSGDAAGAAFMGGLIGGVIGGAIGR